MEEYKVTEKDLIGQIEGFPIEVVQKMVDYQVEQGNKADVKLFQEAADEMLGGFFWAGTKEGRIFWYKVINNKDFALFFDKYPKNKTSGSEANQEVDTHVYYRGNAERGEEIISELEKLGGNNNYGLYNGKSDEEYYFINPKDHLIRHIRTVPKNFSDHLPLDFLKSFYTEKFLPEVQPEVKSETIEIDGKKYNKQDILDSIKELKEVE